jgi:hypothetical protein
MKVLNTGQYPPKGTEMQYDYHSFYATRDLQFGYTDTNGNLQISLLNVIIGN